MIGRPLPTTTTAITLILVLAKSTTTTTNILCVWLGVPFLGKVSHPYGYQEPSKQVIIRTCQRAKNIQYENEKNLIAKVNSQVGTLKGYNCRKLIRNYIDLLPSDAQNIIKERIKMVN